MTEYDYSPAALQQHLAKQKQIAKWADRCNEQKDKQGNPFLPSLNRDSDFYSKPSTPSEIYGPDRPPSPPAFSPGGYSFPPYGGGYGYGYGGGGGSGGGGGYNAGYTSAPYQAAPNNVLSPTWNGYAWVYQPPNNIQPLDPSFGRPEHHHRHKSRRPKSMSNIGNQYLNIPQYPQPASAQQYNFASLPPPPLNVNGNGMAQNFAQSHMYRSGSSSKHRQHRSVSVPAVIYPSPQGMMQSPPPSPTPGYSIVVIDESRHRSSKLKKGRR